MKSRSLNILLLLLLFLLPASASEPEAIIVHLQGDAQKSILLGNIKKFYFSNSKVVFEKKDNSQTSHPIKNISKITFGDMLPEVSPILKSFTVKETSGTIDYEANTVVVENLDTDQTDCLEVYFELNDLYSLEDYEVYLEGDNDVSELLGTSVCFGNVFGWTGTLYVVQKSTAPTPVETYDVTILDVPTGLSSGAGKEVQDTQYYTITGIRINGKTAQGIVIKRTIFSDGSVRVVKEVK